MPRRKAWNGQKPGDAEEARRHLIDVAGEIVEEVGLARASLAEVAERAGVTRQTVYRYFEDTDDLFRSAAVTSAGGLLERLIAHVRTVDGWPERLIEGTVFAVREIPKDPNLQSLLEGPEGIDHELLSSLNFARETTIDLAEGEVALPDDEFDELTELMLRLADSFLHTAPERARTDDELRAFLVRWIAPGIQQRMERYRS